ncbi:hypothetical protein ACFE04_015489 [Oxalis oulophora]
MKFTLTETKSLSSSSSSSSSLQQLEQSKLHYHHHRRRNLSFATSSSLTGDKIISVLGIILGGGAGTLLYPLTKKRQDGEMRVMFVSGDNGQRFVRYGVNGDFLISDDDDDDDDNGALIVPIVVVASVPFRLEELVCVREDDDDNGALIVPIVNQFSYCCYLFGFQW